MFEIVNASELVNIFGTMEEPIVTAKQIIGHNRDATVYLLADTTQPYTDFTIEPSYFYCTKFVNLGFLNNLDEVKKRLRAFEVDNLKVACSDGYIFDGDEVSQDRMSRALLGMNDTDIISWKTADNNFVNINKAKLAEILRKAGEIQTQIWVKYG